MREERVPVSSEPANGRLKQVETPQLPMDTHGLHVFLGRYESMEQEVLLLPLTRIPRSSHPSASSINAHSQPLTHAHSVLWKSHGGRVTTAQYSNNLKCKLHCNLNYPGCLNCHSSLYRHMLYGHGKWCSLSNTWVCCLWGNGHIFKGLDTICPVTG